MHILMVTANRSITTDNHSGQLIDVAILSNGNGDPISDLDDDTINALEQIGFTKTGNDDSRWCLTLNQRNCWASTSLNITCIKIQLENEIKALEKVNEIREILDYVVGRNIQVGLKIAVLTFTAGNKLERPSGVGLYRHLLHCLPFVERKRRRFTRCLWLFYEQLRSESFHGTSCHEGANLENSFNSHSFRTYGWDSEGSALLF